MQITVKCIKIFFSDVDFFFVDIFILGLEWIFRKKNKLILLIQYGMIRINEHSHENEFCKDTDDTYMEVMFDFPQ